MQIYHPNIDLDGNVCLNILREDWKPVLDINSVIYGLIYLFYEPNPDDPLNKGLHDTAHCICLVLEARVLTDVSVFVARAEAAELFRNDPTQFATVVRQSLRWYSVRGIAFEKLI